MKKLTSKLAILAATAGILLVSQTAHAQPGGNPMPHKVGLIDMAHIFKHYKKFTDQREDLKKEIERSDATAKAMVADIKKLQDQLKNPMFKSDSPQGKQLRQQLITASAKYQTYRQDEQQRFLTSEAKIYKTVYMEVTKSVATYARYYKYTLVLRWSKEGVDSVSQPKQILSKMNRLVIYSRAGDDITKVILDHLNGQYIKTTGRGRTRN